MAALIKERQAQDPSLGAADAFVALELLKATLLEESGVAVTGRRVALIAAVALCTAVVGVALFLLSH